MLWGDIFKTISVPISEGNKVNLEKAVKDAQDLSKKLFEVSAL